MEIFQQIFEYSEQFTAWFVDSPLMIFLGCAVGGLAGYFAAKYTD